MCLLLHIRIYRSEAFIFDGYTLALVHNGAALLQGQKGEPGEPGPDGAPGENGIDVSNAVCPRWCLLCV